jgi:CO dehydrogenase maturation factor
VTTTIAVAGKGGTGKTTITGLLIRYLNEHSGKPILAIDADPSSNLNNVLGLSLERTIGDIREDMLDQVRTSASVANSAFAGVGKRDYLSYQVQLALVEGKHTDLLAMGRPEGQGCYCAANNMMRDIIDRMSASYDYVMIDNEAGMEHLSRRTTRDVDHLLVVADTSQRSLIAAERIVEMVPGLNINVQKTHLIVNRVTGELPAAVQATIEKLNVQLLGVVPNDPKVAEFDVEGKPLVELPEDSLVVQAVWRIANQLFLG